MEDNLSVVYSSVTAFDKEFAYASLATQAKAKSVYGLVPVLTHVVELDMSNHCVFFSNGDFLIDVFTSSSFCR